MEKATVLQGIRLTPADYVLLRQLAGPRGGSRLVRGLLRAEAARRAILQDSDKRRVLTA